MTKNQIWVDSWFVQATAWYLQLDLWIINCTSTEKDPFITISGNLADANKACIGPIVTIGTKSNSHYQSLLPTEMFHLEFNRNQLQEQEHEEKTFNENDTEEIPKDPDSKTTVNFPNELNSPSSCGQTEGTVPAKKKKVLLKKIMRIVDHSITKTMEIT